MIETDDAIASETDTALADARRALREGEAHLREAQHRARNTVQVTLSLLNLYGRAMPPEAAGLFGSLSRRIRAIGIVGACLPEGPEVVAVDLTDYLQQVAGQLAALYEAEGPVVVAGARVELAPPRAHAVGTLVAECLGALLRPGARANPGARIELTRAAGGATRLAITGEAVAEPDAPPRLGERLVAAYAVRAGAELRRGEASTEIVIPAA